MSNCRRSELFEETTPTGHINYKLSRTHKKMGASPSFPVVELSGKVAIVTGGNTGLGYEKAKALAVMGAHTIIACRSLERANTVCPIRN